MSLHSNLTGLSLRGSTPQRDVPQWNQQSRREMQSVGSRPLAAYQTPSSTQNTPSRDRLGLTEKAPTQESTVVPNHKRQGRHNGLVISSAPGSQAPRTSPEDSSSSDGVTTPSTSSLEYHPAIVHSNGYVEPQHPSILADLSQNVRTKPSALLYSTDDELDIDQLCV
jgi:C2H2 transcription facotor